jgi:hypothetical protein
LGAPFTIIVVIVSVLLVPIFLPFEQVTRLRQQIAALRST